MIRKIIQIDQEKCNGCGLCAEACHEGAIEMKDGKAVLTRDDYCDGLGDCLPACPTNAITFTEREAAAYDHAAVQQHLAKRDGKTQATPDQEDGEPLPCGCPGSAMKSLRPATSSTASVKMESPAGQIAAGTAQNQQAPVSELRQWPVQIKLAPVNAPFFRNADLLIAADCTAYAFGDFHDRFIRGRITLIGCPKLDEGDYTEKLTAIFEQNSIRSVTVTRMEVPCCGGIVRAVEQAIALAAEHSGHQIPLRVHTLSTEGTIL